MKSIPPWCLVTLLRNDSRSRLNSTFIALHSVHFLFVLMNDCLWIFIFFCMTDCINLQLWAGSIFNLIGWWARYLSLSPRQTDGF